MPLPTQTREIPRFTLDGVRDADVSTRRFHTDDGLALSLLRFRRPPSDDAVLLIHGLTSSSDMFIMPEHRNLVQVLLDSGFGDVWCLDCRMSNRFAYNHTPNRFTLDDVALFDHPAALAAMRAQIGDRPVHVICHCLGSLSFMMSLAAGCVDGIASVVSNSVALIPRVSRWARTKLAFGPFLVERALGSSFLSPLWAEEPGLTPRKLVSRLVSLRHRECDDPVCHMLSFMWGDGHPAMYSHARIADVTHRRARDLFGATSVHYYRHIRAMVRAGRAVKHDPDDPRHQRLPNDYLARAPQITTPTLLVTGDRNHVFTDSNIACHRHLDQATPGRHRLHVFPGYGHQDVFMGKDCATDVFPAMLSFLTQHRV
ncbi:MAG: alpha/beta fold hydrolase [Egibacteraceae bacterium]